MKPSGSGHSRIIAHPRGTRESRPELEAPARFLDRVKTRFPAGFVESAMVTADRERRAIPMLIYRARYERLLLNSH